MEINSISLYQLNKSIQETIRSTLNGSYWIKAEIAQLKENYNGHCYVELIEKDQKSERIIAQAKGNIWATVYRMLKPYFETTTGRKLQEGFKVLLCVRVEFHELYGFSLNITDIDPSYTVGDLALKKADIIKRLKEDGVFDMNREQELSIVPQRVAVISSETAAGYLDFKTHIFENEFGYRFYLKLFPSLMQGEKAEESIINSLEEINNNIENFDVVVILRGGGSQTDLSCFDSYLLASHVAQFPLPVLTGIGHEQDDSVVDMVAHTRLKTPTAVAGFLIDCCARFEARIDELFNQTTELIQDIISGQENILERILFSMPVTVKEKLHYESSQLESASFRVSKVVTNKLQVLQYNQNLNFFKLKSGLKQFYQNENLKIKHNINSLQNTINRKFMHLGSQLEIFGNIANLSNPENILKKGFSITVFNNKPVTDSETLSDKAIIETKFYKGKISSEVIVKS
jgi:exodeoxyribonuclease VII large subunit